MTEKNRVRECIDVCLDCHRVCLETIQYCLKQGGRHSKAAHIQLLQSCATICETSAVLMIAESELHPSTCAVCRDACLRCAVECEAFLNDLQMKRCADLCRRCAEACDEMSRGEAAA